MSLARGIQQNSFNSPEDTFLNNLRSTFLIDYGLITYVYDRKPDESFNNGIYVDVRTLDAVDLHNVEVLFMGNQRQVLETMPSEGDRVIVFGTKRAISSIENMGSQVTEAYDETTVKCMPVGRIRKSLAKVLLDNGVFLSHAKQSVGVDSGGRYIHETTGYRKIVNPDGSLTEFIGKMQITTRDVDGNLEYAMYDTPEGDGKKILLYQKRGADGILETDSGEVSTVADAFDSKKWMFKLIQNPDGSLTRTMSTDGEELVNVITIGADGAFMIDVGDGKATVELTPDGAITWHTDTDFTLDITGAYELSANGLSLDATDGKIAIKNGSKSLFTIMDTLIGAFSDAAPATQGSPAAHTFNPSIVQALTTAKSDLAELMEA
jgi:hypothetical protein